jgi:hypothetical protein
LSKLTKAQAKAHAEAVKLLSKDSLTEDERWFVLENWQESANHINSIAGAFFTPVGLARDFSIEVSGKRILDLCAGIGGLSYLYTLACQWDRMTPDIVCVEKNPGYVAVGRKILPEARWIEGDVFNLPADLGHFDCAISNPPFGATSKDGQSGPRYTGNKFEYHVIDIASDHADYGVFIIPQTSAPFKYSGQDSYERTNYDHCRDFTEKTGIDLGHSCGIDTSYYLKDWRGVSPPTEIVVCDFAEARERRKPVQPDMFAQAAE